MQNEQLQLKSQQQKQQQQHRRKRGHNDDDVKNISPERLYEYNQLFPRALSTTMAEAVSSQTPATVSTPSSSTNTGVNGASQNGAKASKDRKCEFCNQAFTSSSLGRHLDLYIKPKVTQNTIPQSGYGRHSPTLIQCSSIV